MLKVKFNLMAIAMNRVRLKGKSIVFPPQLGSLLFLRHFDYAVAALDHVLPFRSHENVVLCKRMERGTALMSG